MNARLPDDTATAANDAPFDILDAFHRQIQFKLCELRDVAAAIEAGELTPTLRAQARSVRDWFNSEAREHHLDEERNVFPALLASGKEELVQQTNRLIQDHGWLEADWLEIEPSLGAAADGNTWFDPAVLRHAIEIFNELYTDHIVLEESIAYPEARQRIAPEKWVSMFKEMANRRLVREEQVESRQKAR
mgnify:CR=1 FL=1